MRGAAWYRAKAGRRDTTHASVRDGLEKLGHIVADLGGAAGGVPDLAVRHPRWNSGVWRWLEVKTARGGLTPAQRELHARWLAKGVRVLVVKSLDEALSAVSAEAA